MRMRHMFEVQTHHPAQTTEWEGTVNMGSDMICEAT